MKTLTPSVAELQREHVTMERECVDRMYLNAYVPKLTSAAAPRFANCNHTPSSNVKPN